ncbi:MAG: hypothetical protein EU529_13365 [Promethearchaeota archaeon]|nr:MAG: hypothetical protein EU529_13365 [Candidatus Lokiarchaeota archaeon]
MVKCIKCGLNYATEMYNHMDVQIKFRWFRHTNLSQTRYITLPVCTGCHKQFKDYEEKRLYNSSKEDIICCILAFSPVIVIFALFSAASIGALPALITFCIGVAGIILIFYYLRKVEKGEPSPHGYIKVSGNIVKVKPATLKNWILLDEWLQFS